MAKESFTIEQVAQVVAERLTHAPIGTDHELLATAIPSLVTGSQLVRVEAVHASGVTTQVFVVDVMEQD